MTDRVCQTDNKAKNKKVEGKISKKSQQEVPVRDTTPPAGTMYKNTSVNAFAKKKLFVSRHHLDDTGAR